MKKTNRTICMLLIWAILAFGAAGCAQTDDSPETQGETGLAPGPVICELFDAAGDMTLTLHLADEGACSPYTVTDRQFAEHVKGLIECYEWTETEEADMSSGEYWLTAASSNGVNCMTFLSGGAGMIRYDNGVTTTCWTAVPQSDSAATVAELIRREYDSLDFDTSRISFSLEGGAEEAAEAFVQDAYGAHLMYSLVPGNGNRVTDYAVVDWGVQEISEDGAAVVGWFSYAFVPEDMDSPDIWAGNTVQGTGEYEGMLKAFREFVLQKQKDGCWHCVGSGTGGCTLPE